MGRSAGFIAAYATLGSGDVDLCLVPEVPIILEGELGCLPHLYKRVKEKGYAVVVVAEGAGEDVLGISLEVSLSVQGISKLFDYIFSYHKSMLLLLKYLSD